jgi:hypothetical protein
LRIVEANLKLRGFGPTGALAVLTLISLSAATIEAQVQPALTWTPVREIGVAVGEPDYEFGKVEGVAATESGGHIFVLDQIRARLSVFRATGEFVAATGRVGAGPGEFRNVQSVAVDDAGRVHVYDGGNLRISTYVLRGSILELVNEVRVPIFGRHMCVLDGDYYLVGLHQGRIVHRLDRTGEVVASFGDPIRSGHPLVERHSSYGRIFCDERNRSVFVAGVGTPVLRRYSADGSLQWERTIPGFRAITIVPNAHGGVTLRAPDGQRLPTASISLLTLPDDRVLIQYAEPVEGVRTPEEIRDVMSALYRLDGTLIGITRSLPRVDHVAGNLLFSRAMEDYPRVRIYMAR